MRPDGLRAVERAGQVDPEVALPEIQPLVAELPDVVERARVVDEDVDAAQLLDHTGDGGVDVFAIGDVAAHRERVPSQRADLVDRRLGMHHPLRHRRLGEWAVRLRRARVRLDEDVRDHDVSACAGERQRVRAAEAP